MADDNSMSAKLKLWLSSEHVEVTLRLTFCMFIAYALSIADIPEAVPPSRSLLLAVVVPFFAMLVPTMVFIFGAVVMPTFTLFLIAYAAATAMMAAAVAGGDGAFLATYALFMFWSSFLRWDKRTGGMTSLLIIAVVYNTILGFPNYKTVQDGFRIIFSTSSGEFTSASKNTITFTLIELANQFQDDLREVVATAQSTGTAVTETVTEGDLKGLALTITPTTGDETFVDVPGGIWLVKAMWTASGMTNPLAVYKNNFIMLGYTYLLMALIFFIPPFRTMRNMISKKVIPAALGTSSKLVKLHYSSKSASPEDLTAIQKQKTELKMGLLKYYNILNGGKLAAASVFEPRLFRCAPPECSFLSLMGLSDATSKALLVAIGIEEMVNWEEGDILSEFRRDHDTAASSWAACAGALTTGTTAAAAAAAASDALTENSNDTGDPFRTNFYSKAVVESTEGWLEATGTPKSSSEYFSQASWSAFKMNVKPWIKAHTSFLEVMWAAVLSPANKSFRKKKAIFKMAWSIKYTFGMTILFVLVSYWPAYEENFFVPIGGRSSDVLFDLSVSLLNTGWAIVSFCFATTQTTEGTVKKGMLRIAGTTAGAGVGWLALVACEDSTYERQYNPYGLVAWLTITTALATYFSTERGLMARLGLSSDYMFGPIYFVITEVIVIMYVFLYYGPEGRDEVTVNRLIGNLVGIGLALVLAILPLGNWGGDPRHCQQIVTELRQAISGYIGILLDGKSGAPKEVADELIALRSQHLNRHLQLHELANDFYDDAARFSAFPMFQVDPNLKLQIALVAREITVASFVATIGSRIVHDPMCQNVILDENSKERRQIKSFLSKIQNNSINLTDPDNQKASKYSVDEEADGVSKESQCLLELFLRLLQMLENRLDALDKDLDSTKWGFMS